MTLKRNFRALAALQSNGLRKMTAAAIQTAASRDENVAERS